MATVAEQLATNIHLADAPDRTMFQQRRDVCAAQTHAFGRADQFRGGRAPTAEDNGRRYLKIPMYQFEER